MHVIFSLPLLTGETGENLAVSQLSGGGSLSYSTVMVKLLKVYGHFGSSYHNMLT